MTPIAARLLALMRRPVVWIPAAVLAAGTALFWCTDLDRDAGPAMLLGLCGRHGRRRPVSDGGTAAVEIALSLGGMAWADSRMRRHGCLGSEFLLDEAGELARPGAFLRVAADRRAWDSGELRVQALLEPSAAARHHAVRRPARVSACLAARLRRRGLLISQRTRGDGLLPDGAGVCLLSPPAVACRRLSAVRDRLRGRDWAWPAWSPAPISRATCFGPAGSCTSPPWRWPRRFGLDASKSRRDSGLGIRDWSQTVGVLQS